MVDADLALRAVALLQNLLERVVGERAAEEARQRSVVRQTYTPRSDAPLSRLAVAPVMPPRLRRRSLHFSCPCCSREMVVIRRQAGARIRCPHCDAAVVAPHPRRRLSAHNCERDIEAVLHPERFGVALKPMPPRWVRWVAREPVLILALAALVPCTALLMLEIPGVIDRAKGGVPSNMMGQSVPEQPARGPTDNAAERAVAVVEKYLAAPGVAAKAAWVRDRQRVAPLMASLAADKPELFRTVTGAKLTAGGLTHYKDPKNPVSVTPVLARLEDGTSRAFYVEHSESGDTIEWESSVGYSEALALTPARRGKTAAPTRAVWRVEAVPDDYFNRAFNDEDGLICLKLARADQPDETFWAYTPKDSDVAAALRRVWNEAPRDFAQRLTVTVEAESSAAKTRQVRLAKVNHAGWRTPDAAALMVAGNP
jgi:hypothetical protein